MTLEPYYADDRATLYLGEALDVLRQLPAASCDVLLTDPPYSSGGMFRGDRNIDPAEKYSMADGKYGTFGGDSRDQRSFTAWVGAWSWAAMRVVRPAGSALMFTDWRQIPVMTDALQLGGWVWRGLVTWCKGPGGGMPQRGKFRQNAEYVVWGTHGAQTELADGVFSSVIELPTVPDLPEACTITVPTVPGQEREHVTQKPLELLEHLLQVVPWQRPLTVLDPFAGSGTTLVAAKALGHRAIGVECDERYAEVVARRLAALQPSLFDDLAAAELEQIAEPLPLLLDHAGG